jgi:hypothetical protein
MIAGVVLARGLVLLASLILSWTSLSVVGMGVAAMKPGLLVLLWLWSRGRARQAFAVALAVTAVGAFVDALTPSYDASAFWLWAGPVLTVAADFAVMVGIFQLNGGRAGTVLFFMGTILSLAHVINDWELLRPLSVPVLSLAHIVLYPSLRRPFAPSAAPEAGRALLLWGGVELGRFLLMGLALLAAAGLSLSDRDAGYLGLGVAVAGALAAAAGYRWLARFCDGAGVRAGMARAVPLVGAVAALAALPDVAEALFAGREAAMSRAGVNAVTACLLYALGVAFVAGAARRMLKKLGRRGLARALGVSGWALLAIPLLLVATPLLESISWEMRRFVRDFMPLLAIAFGVAWLASAVLLMVGGVSLKKSATG